MCGICGIIPKNRVAQEDILKVKSMNDALVHRGPDSEGYFNDTRVSLGMRRLSIIDLDTGSQPLYNEDKSIVVIANEEVYNFVELREELIKKGHRFSSKSDCETIIHAYEEYGEDRFLDHLRGMFAFCLYDMKSERVLLARDRMGEKPLYVHDDGGSLIFSSELKSLLEAVPEARRYLDKDSIYLYFHYGYIPCARTMFKDITRVSPGQIIAIDLKSKKTTTKTYWDKTVLGPYNIDQSPAKEIANSLDEIEKIIIRSDVPVGISLSGGLDSGTIATLAARYSKKPLHAFSVGYPGEPENDERISAKKLADKLGLIFHSIELSEQQFVRDFPELIAAMDEPIADIAAYGYFAVSKDARKNNVPVLLAGFGGDELFWGYRWVREAALYNDMKMSVLGRCSLFFILCKKFWRETIRKPLTFISENSRSAFSDKVVLYELSPLWAYVRKNNKEMFRKDFLASIDENSPHKAQEKNLGNKNGTSLTELITDLWLVANCIDLGDRMSMAHSIELRLPLVDYRLYERVTAIRKKYPMDYRLGYKHWLIEAVRQLLPDFTIERQKKGFTPPTQLWVENAITAYSSTLQSGYLIKNGIIDKSFMERAIAQPNKNQKFLYAALVFELWAGKYLS